MTTDYEIDNLDRQILEYLRRDGRMAFTEIAQKLIVSAGTIHQRVNKMTDAGIITGSKITVDYSKLGYDVTSLMGIYLKSARDLEMVMNRLRTFDEIVEVYYTTGSYALIIKARTRTTDAFYQFLLRKLQAIPEIQSTESFICLAQPIDRDLPLADLEGV
ncbi:MAG: Lrp/AsnC ligand binding domain-containing protein [candidate division Zixibacteria bacterium]|nr:Lrp/AsnC ligand binding domain-containing protein [candidate division Zixibacteria bacterium]MDH3936121.1 Lrp/AsnC ligand binding domain-containing protein [candidate division Zixibacteria bacterium]MDH4032634.1 Lrp/AsnC ligand binding domain-containing protein [candidate division Zixibacteria bacterium]